MTLRSAGRLLRVVATIPAVMVLSSCAVPLGPGYQIEKQQLEIRYLAASPTRLHIRASYRLRNIGNRDLSFLEATLPDEARGRQSLRAAVDGREVSLQMSIDARPGTVRVPFDRPWPPKQRHALLFEYDLAPAPPGQTMLAVNDSSFHSLDATAFPLLHPPAGGLIERGKPPSVTRLAVQVPPDFQVFAGGREQGSSRRGAETEYRFGASRQNFDLFIVAGRYQQQTIKIGGTAVLFWTFDPLPAEQAQAAATRLAGTFQTFRATFGALWKTAPAVRVMETPAHLTDRPTGAGDAAGTVLPASVLLNRPAFAAGVASDTFLNLAEHELAHTWFGQAIEPWPRTEAVLGEGLSEYATIVAAEARGGEAERQRQAALLLRRFDESRKKAADKPLLRLEPSDPSEQRVFGYSKGALFFVALEDRYGKENVRRAIARVVGSLQGSRFGYADLLSALELETGQKLGDFFRLWLDQTGIPEDVRARYQEKLEPKS